MSDATPARADLQKKDRSELQTIITALGGKPASRAKKDDLISMVIELTSGGGGSGGDGSASAPGPDGGRMHDSGSEDADHDAADHDADSIDDDPAGEVEDQSDDSDSGDSDDDDSDSDDDEQPQQRSRPARNDRNKRGQQQRADGSRDGSKGNERGGRNGGNDNRGAKGDNDGKSNSESKNEGKSNAESKNDGKTNDPNRSDQKDDGNAKTDHGGDDDEQGNRRRRRRGRGRDRDEEQVNTEPAAIGGNLDLREEGYGFLRVEGALPSPDDVYVPLKTVRIHGLRKGDYVAGTARPASRNERNSALHSLDLVNDKDPGKAKDRPRFEKQTPVFPSEAMSLETEGSVTGRILDLMVPLGKGQRTLIVAPPETGASTLLGDIATAIEANHADTRLIVMLLDERPEEITAFSRRLETGEVISSAFDRPPEEQVAVAEMAIERAKRMVEEGEDVVVLVDGLTELLRAFNLSAPAGGRLLSGGVDASAIYPAKKFFGAARALEEGGSLTMIATVTAETGSPIDQLILDEFRGTATAEIRLSRHLADRGVFPAIDPQASYARALDQLLDTDEVALVEKFHQSVAGDDALSTMQNLLRKIDGTSSNADLLSKM